MMMMMMMIMMMIIMMIIIIIIIIKFYDLNDLHCTIFKRLFLLMYIVV